MVFVDQFITNLQLFLSSVLMFFEWRFGHQRVTLLIYSLDDTCWFTCCCCKVSKVSDSTPYFWEIPGIRSSVQKYRGEYKEFKRDNQVPVPIFLNSREDRKCHDLGSSCISRRNNHSNFDTPVLPASRVWFWNVPCPMKHLRKCSFLFPCREVAVWECFFLSVKAILRS